MSDSSDPNNSRQFLVAARKGAAATEVAAFEQALQSVPGAAVLKRGGRPDQPRLVVTLQPGTVEQLKSRFGATLIIEHDAEIKPL
jgi:hypothetical protein